MVVTRRIHQFFCSSVLGSVLFALFYGAPLLAMNTIVNAEQPAQNTHSDTTVTSTRSNETNPIAETDDADEKQQQWLLKLYRSNILKKTYQHIVYPDSAIDKNHEGEVVLIVTVDRQGNLKQYEFSTRATYNSLNKAATRALNRAKPFSAAPHNLQGETFEFTMPIRFRLAG